MANQDSIILRAEGLNKTYVLNNKDPLLRNEIQAVKSVSLEIKRGEFVSIIGKSGSGKSTLMHMLGLLDTPTKGKLFINGIETSTMTDIERAKIRNKEIGFVFQSFNLLSRTTSLENVILPLKYSDIPRKQWHSRAEKMLNVVELGNRLLNKSNELSGGQKQRVAIARALVTDPSIILADEPTGNLDSKTGAEIFSLFRKLNDGGTTIIIVTHDDEIATLTKRKIVISDGEVVSS